MLIMDKSKIFFLVTIPIKCRNKLAVTNSIEILKIKQKIKFLINLMGEFEDFSYKGQNYFSKYQKFFTSKWIIIKNLNMDYKYYIYTWLIINLKKNNADIIISNLISIIPLFIIHF